MTPSRLAVLLAVALDLGAAVAFGGGAPPPAPPGDRRVRFVADVPRGEAIVAETWKDLEARFGGATAPDLTVSVEAPDAGSVQAEAARQRSGRIVLSRFLAGADLEVVMRHELAHVYLEARCPDLARAAPLVSEAFALFTSRDAERRALAGERFPFVTRARDFLSSREGRVDGHEPDTQEALARVLAQPGVAAGWEGWFASTLATCGGTSFSAARVHARLFERLRAVPTDEAPTRVDFLLVDGLSRRTLLAEGRLDDPMPVGSILKPSLVAAVPALLEPRPARDALEWHCPDAPIAGAEWTWRRALTRSCNGFFLDLPSTSSGAFSAWEDEMRALGMRDVPTGMPGRLGLTAGTRLSARQVARLYAWLAEKAPVVMDALRETVNDGTLASAPDAAWFRERGVALKTGTVRDARSAPHDAWIAAVGPRLPSGEGRDGRASFVAALHATGLASPALLPLLRERLARVLHPAPDAAVRVQILGLAPFGSVSISCEDEAPLIVRDPAGEVSLRPAGTVAPAGDLAAGSRYACAAAPLWISFARANGERRRRAYPGFVDVEDSPTSDLPSSVPLREKSARARRGSRLVLTTSETAYLESTLLSEHAGGSPEVLKALALVARHDLLVPRHEGRPPCDTTHCHLFGQEDERTPRRGAREAVAAIEGLRLETGSERPEWLSFFLGGEETWTRRLPVTEVVAKLHLARAAPPALTGSLRDADGLLVPCERVRNQLRLPSCPERIEHEGAEVAFSGRGEGHGEGMDLVAAERLAAGGATFRDLIARFYPGVTVRETAIPTR